MQISAIFSIFFGGGPIAEYSLHTLVLQKTALTNKNANPYVRKQDLNSSLAAMC